MAKVNNSKAKLQEFLKENEVAAPRPLVQPTPLINAIAELGTFKIPSPIPNSSGLLVTIPDGYPVVQAEITGAGGKPVQRDETNGLFNLLSSFIKYSSQGGATTFDSAFASNPLGGYTTGAVLYYADPTNANNPINGWYTKLNANTDTAFPNANWKQITGVTPPVPPVPLQLYQQGRLTGLQGSPYGDTGSTGNSTLYFTPTEQGNLISLWNGTSWVTQTFIETSLGVGNLSGTYDIYIDSSTTDGTLRITPIAWNNSTTPPTARIQLANGKWIYNSAIKSILVGSINVTGGVVISWSGNRSIWNLYNQVSRPLTADGGKIDPYAFNTTASLWQLNGITSNTNFRNQNGSTVAGIGRFEFILDPLYNKRLLLSYNGSGVSGASEDNGTVGIIANTSLDQTVTTTQPLNFALYYADPSGGGNINNFHTLSYSHNYTSASANYQLGYNYIQKIERSISAGYFSDTGGGLTAEFWC